MTKRKPTVYRVKIGDIPARTMVRGIASPHGILVVKDSGVKEYYCLDCDFQTDNIYEMREHQHSFKHSILTRLKRWLLSKTISQPRLVFKDGVRNWKERST